MSCEKCEAIQEAGTPVAFVRIDKANVLCVGCKEHLGKMFNQLRDYRRLVKHNQQLFKELEMYKGKSAILDQLLGDLDELINEKE